MNKKEASSPLSLRRTPITPSRSRGRVRNNKGRRLGLAAASTPLFSNHTTGRVETVTTNTANVEEEEVEVIDNENEEEEIEVMGVKRPSLLIQERLHCADKSGQVVSLVDTPDKIKTTVKTTVVVDKENAEVEDKQKRPSSSTTMVSNPTTGRDGSTTINTANIKKKPPSSSTAMVSSPGRDGTTTSFVIPRSQSRCQRFAIATALKHRQGRSSTRRDIATATTSPPRPTRSSPPLSLVDRAASTYTAPTSVTATASNRQGRSPIRRDIAATTTSLPRRTRSSLPLSLVDWLGLGFDAIPWIVLAVCSIMDIKCKLPVMLLLLLVSYKHWQDASR